MGDLDGIKSKGMILTAVLSVFIFINIFLAGFDYRQTLHRWNSHGGYRVIGALEITLVVVAFVIIILSFLSFSVCYRTKGVVIIFVALNSLSMIFTMSVSFFTLIAGSIGKMEKYIGCNTEYKGIIKYWRSIDNYLKAVDQHLCNEGCECDIKDVTYKLFRDDVRTGAFFEKLNKGSGKNVRIQDCNNENSLYLFPEGEIKKFKSKIFNNFWKHIENKFDCSGFCATIYTYDKNGGWPNNEEVIPNQVAMMKYLFTDVNRGPVKYRGCFRRLMKWLPKMLISFGCFALFASLIQIILFILSLSLLKNQITGEGEEVPNDEKKIEMKQGDSNKEEHEGLKENHNENQN